MQRIGGLRRKTRHLFTVPRRMKGKVTITKHMEEFEEGDKVKLIYNATIHKSPFKARHYGRVGVVSKKRGSCYEVSVKTDHSVKTVIVHPVHLQRL